EEGLDRGRDVAATLEDHLREAAIDLRMSFEDHGAGAQAPRLAQGHARVEAKASRLVRARGDDAGAHDHRLPRQARIAQLLDRGEERVDVDVQDHAIGDARHHPSSETESSHHSISADWSWS